jgi:hypothetical protein
MTARRAGRQKRGRPRLRRELRKRHVLKLEDEIYRPLQMLAEEEGCTAADYARQILRRHVRRRVSSP